MPEPIRPGRHRYTVAEYAERHAIDRRTVFRWIKSGQIPARSVIRLGKRTLRIEVERRIIPRDQSSPFST